MLSSGTDSLGALLCLSWLNHFSVPSCSPSSLCLNTAVHFSKTVSKYIFRVYLSFSIFCYFVLLLFVYYIGTLRNGPLCCYFWCLRYILRHFFKHIVVFFMTNQIFRLKGCLIGYMRLFFPSATVESNRFGTFSLFIASAVHFLSPGQRSQWRFLLIQAVQLRLNSPNES